MLVHIPTASTGGGVFGCFGVGFFFFFAVSLSTVVSTPHRLQDRFYVDFSKQRVKRKRSASQPPACPQAAPALLHPQPLPVRPIAGSYKERMWEFPQPLKKGNFDHEIPENTAGNSACSTLTYKRFTC